MADYELLIRDRNLALVSYLWPRQSEIPPLSIRWTRHWRNPGVLELHIPRETDLAAALATIGSFIEVRRDGAFEAIYLIRAIEVQSGVLTYSRGVQDAFNAVYAGGQGEGTDRLVVLRENVPSLADVGRIERFLDARDVEQTNLPLLINRADAAVSDASVPESAVANVGEPQAQDIITVWGVSPLVYAAGRVVLPPPGTRVAGSDLVLISGDVYDRVTGVPADVAMTYYVSQHMVNPIDPTRKVPLLTIVAPPGSLPITSYTSRFQTVLEVLQDLGANNDAGYEIVRAGSELQFVVLPVRDRTVTGPNPVIIRDDEVLLDIPGRAYRAEWDVGDRITLELRDGYRADLRVFEVAVQLEASRAVEISMGVTLEAVGDLVGGIIEASTQQGKALVRVEPIATSSVQTLIDASPKGGIVHYDYVVDSKYTGVDGVTITMATGSSAKVYKTIQAAVNAWVAAGGFGNDRSILLNAGAYGDVTIPFSAPGALWIHGEAANTSGGVTGVSIQNLYILTGQVIHLKNLRVVNQVVTPDADIDVHTHWEDCEISTLDAQSGGFGDSSFRRCYVDIYYPRSVLGSIVTFSDCSFGSQIWTLGYEHEFVNCKFSGILAIWGVLHDFHFTNCLMPTIAVNFGGGGTLTYTACKFPVPPDATGVVHIVDCSSTGPEADPTIFQFIGGRFKLNVTDPTWPFILSDDPDFQTVVVGFDLVDNVAPYIIGQFKNSVFGPNFPIDFAVQLDATSLNNERVGTGPITGADAFSAVQVGIAQEEALSLGNGANDDIVLPSAFVRIDGPTGAFSVSGFASPTEGREVTVYNSVAQDMTITNDASSAAANRILTLTGGDVTLLGISSASFRYSAADSRWILIATSGAT